MAPFEYNEAAGVLNYVIRLSNGKTLELQIRGGANGVSIESHGPFREAEILEIKDKVTWMLGLEMDFSAFYAVASNEPKLAHVERKAYGRILRSPTFFEDVIKTILTTNTLWAATKRMTAKLIATFGEPIPATDKRAFPTPASIVNSDLEVLKETVRVGYRAPSIHELAAHVASGDLDLEAYKTSPSPTLELREELLKIRGVGPYAAANLLMILGRSDFIPIDSWALKLVSHEWYDGESVTAAQVAEHFEKWGEFKGLAYWFWDWDYKG